MCVCVCEYGTDSMASYLVVMHVWAASWSHPCVHPVDLTLDNPCRSLCVHCVWLTIRVSDKGEPILRDFLYCMRFPLPLQLHRNFACLCILSTSDEIYRFWHQKLMLCLVTSSDYLISVMAADATQTRMLRFSVAWKGKGLWSLQYKS